MIVNDYYNLILKQPCSNIPKGDYIAKLVKSYPCELCIVYQFHLSELNININFPSYSYYKQWEAKEL